VVILLTHHPLNWLAENEYDDYSTLMERYAVLHLHGHIHKTHIEKKQRLFSSSGGYVSIGTGSLYGEKSKEDINTYHIITFDFENQELHELTRIIKKISPQITQIYTDFFVRVS
jgi:predicted phosphodiesterase